MLPENGDGWRAPLSGVGLAAERRMHSAAELWAGSALAAKLGRSRRSRAAGREARLVIRFCFRR